MPNYVDKEISRLRNELSDIRDAIASLRKNGQQYTISGSHGSTGVSYLHLKRDEARILGKIAAMQGAKSSTLPDFS